MENINQNDLVENGNICKYYECGEGWHPLIHKAEKIVEKYNEEHPDLEYPVEFTQIKEKLGYLNLYLNYYPDNLYEQLLDIEYESKHICEMCGEPAESVELHGWIYTLCPECQKKEIERFKILFI